MRIGIDAYYASCELRGMGKYIVRLVCGLLDADRSNEFVIYGDAHKFPGLTPRDGVEFRAPRGWGYPIWEQVVLPEWALNDRLDLLHCPANTGPLVMNRHIRLVLTIHDVMCLVPSTILRPSRISRQRFGRAYRRIIMPRAVKRADSLITVSEFSREQISEYLHVERDRVHVVHEGISEEFASLASRGEAPVERIGPVKHDDSFVLALGAGDPRKNTLGVIRAYALASQKLLPRVKLVIAGMRDWRYSEAYRLVQQLGLGNDVLFVGYVSEPALAWLYSHARCFLYPTLYEGFGFPVLEAMACATPVIASNRTSVSEIAGGAALLVDPSSSEAIAAAMLRVLGDAALQRELVLRGKARVHHFSWQSTVSQTMDVYSTLASGAAPEHVIEA